MTEYNYKFRVGQSADATHRRCQDAFDAIPIQNQGRTLVEVEGGIHNDVVGSIRQRGSVDIVCHPGCFFEVPPTPEGKSQSLLGFNGRGQNAEMTVKGLLAYGSIHHGISASIYGRVRIDSCHINGRRTGRVGAVGNGLWISKPYRPDLNNLQDYRLEIVNSSVTGFGNTGNHEHNAYLNAHSMLIDGFVSDETIGSHALKTGLHWVPYRDTVPFLEVKNSEIRNCMYGWDGKSLLENPVGGPPFSCYSSARTYIHHNKFVFGNNRTGGSPFIIDYQNRKDINGSNEPDWYFPEGVKYELDPVTGLYQLVEYETGHVVVTPGGKVLIPELLAGNNMWDPEWWANARSLDTDPLENPYNFTHLHENNEYVTLGEHANKVSVYKNGGTRPCFGGASSRHWLPTPDGWYERSIIVEGQGEVYPDSHNEIYYIGRSDVGGSYGRFISQLTVPDPTPEPIPEPVPEPTPASAKTIVLGKLADLTREIEDNWKE